MEPILRAEHLTKTFRRKGQEDVIAVNDVSFELMPGECLGIIGESGSGKSTVANLLTRLTEVTEGSIPVRRELLFGKPTEKYRWFFRRRWNPSIREGRWETGSLKAWSMLEPYLTR